MEEITFDRKKVIEEMKALKANRIDEIKRMITDKGEIQTGEQSIDEAITVKYLGKMEFVNEQGELIDKDVFIMIEEHSGQFQIRYYAEDQKLLGIQRTLDEDIIPSGEMLGKLPEKMKNIEKEDIEEAKTLEELEEEQRQEEQEKGAGEQETGQEEQAEEEPQQLPGVDEGPQLSSEEVNALAGQKIDLNQQVDNVTLAQKMDIEGAFIKFVVADDPNLKRFLPDLDLSALGQKFIPLQIFPDGTANVIGEEKLAFSTIEGTNSTKEQSTMNSDGVRTKEQGIETYNIPGTNNCITIGWDEGDINSPFYEAKFGTRVPDRGNEVNYDELQTC